MVVSDSQSKLRSAPFIFDLSFEHLNISSARERLGVTDEDISVHVYFPEELQEEFQKSQNFSPFHEWYVKDDVWPTHACTCENLRGKVEYLAPSPTSAINIPSHSKRGTWQSPCSKRDSLLQDSWQRKRELYLKQERFHVEECPYVEMLGRSYSDCGNPKTGIFQQPDHELLERSMSDCGKPKKEYTLIKPNRLTRLLTRSLTDDDFEELKGCLDLGFRFDQSSIPDLCDTIPALEVVSAVNQNFHESLIASPVQSSKPSPTPSWRITTPGDDPEEVRVKLRHWAQAVACSARLCY